MTPVNETGITTHRVPPLCGHTPYPSVTSPAPPPVRETGCVSDRVPCALCGRESTYMSLPVCYSCMAAAFARAYRAMQRERAGDA